MKECIFCGSKNIVKRGKRYSKYLTNQKWKCKDCGKYFSNVNKKFVRTTMVIIDLHQKGLSSRQISDHLKKFIDHT